MKRILCMLLTVCLLFCFASVGAAAVDDSRSYELDLTVNGSHEVRADPGDILTVNVTLRRTDAAESAPMYAMQDEIRYDDEFLRVVESGILTAGGINTTDIALLDGDRAFYVNFLSLVGGTDWEPEVLAATFQVEVLGQRGSTEMKNENVQVSTKDGADSYQTSVGDLLIIVTEDCTVHFDSCGGTEIPDQLLQIGDRVAKPEDPIREGSTFGGWFTEPELENPWDFDKDTVRGDMTLYAAWEPIGVEDVAGCCWAWVLVLILLLILLFLLFGKRKVQFVVDGQVYATVKVRRGKKLPMPEQPVREGFRFVGWFESPRGNRSWEAEEDKVQISMKLYARWVRL